jgi:hypothetical protein
MEFKDTWRGMKVPESHRTAFFQWNNKSQSEDERDAATILNILNLTLEEKRNNDWKLAERIVLDAPLLCQMSPPRPTGVSNKHGFPNWDSLLAFQQEKANLLKLSEKDFRDYDPVRVARVGGKDAEWVYHQPRYVIDEALAHQGQQTVHGRFLAWTSGIEWFWPAAISGTVLMLIFWWIWGHICPIWPEGLSAHEIEIQNIVNPYYYSSLAEHAIGLFWGSVIFFVFGFAAAMGGYHGSTR